MAFPQHKPLKKNLVGKCCARIFVLRTFLLSGFETDSLILLFTDAYLKRIAYIKMDSLFAYGFYLLTVLTWLLTHLLADSCEYVHWHRCLIMNELLLNSPFITSSVQF